MKTVALVAQKGGIGKSTIAVHLGVCASRHDQSVAIVDLDPQASVATWGDRRAANDVTVVSARIQELPRLLANAKDQGADLVVIDTAGRADTVAMQVMELSDVVLVPCRPFINDVEASRRTAEQVRTARAKRAAFVLNAVPPAGTRHLEARLALEPLLPVAPVLLHHYVAFGDALNDGRSVEELDPEGKAAHEIRLLYRWLLKV
jgi:chromosome partitioning protein